MSVTIQLEDEIDISRGDMLVREKNMPEINQDLDVIINWMSQSELVQRKRLLLKHTTNECIALVKELVYKIDINNNLHRIENIDSVKMNEIARVSIRTSKYIF